MRLEILAILKLFSGIFISTFYIVIGLLFVKHQNFMAYIKDMFTFIKEDYEPKKHFNNIAFSTAFWQVLKDGFFLVIGSKEDSKNEGHIIKLTIPHYIILLGQLIIAFGLVNIIYLFFLMIKSFYRY